MTGSNMIVNMIVPYDCMIVPLLNMIVPSTPPAQALLWKIDRIHLVPDDGR